ncbi:MULTISPECIES: STAS/SEC14 domain-containing protein [unclassified Arthrobacter]|uniref:DUF7793 family protein n=1 Tax=Arthrobacter sp. AET 35A TaxID=2292643 RepID=UPI0014919911|nr:STAS/SEC14 domain-containing protein [Arthrobacter sp. AET 35A]NOJ63853.1 STAS/SEC14 domain-containing protein [Arthrobacter sp. 147(2020)]
MAESLPDGIEGIDATLALGTDSILRLRWARGISIAEEDARRAMDWVNELCAGARHPMLVDMATTKAVSRGAREVFGLPCAASRIALLGSSQVDKVIANFILGVSALPCPTRFFTSETDATDWLRQE